LLQSTEQENTLPQVISFRLNEQLSKRELDVLQLVASGLSNREIAARLVITVGTVKKHIEHIYSKFDAHSRIQVVAMARASGLLVHLDDHEGPLVSEQTHSSTKQMGRTGL
jgi:DNA-binding NarL/FixJ family response regulator